MADNDANPEDMTPELRAAIDVAKQRVKVEPYFTYGMNKGLKGHAQGVWAGTMLGGFTGAVAGSLLTMAFTVAGVPLPVPALGLILGLAGIGTATGGTVGSRIGASTGAISGVVGEFERRQKAEKLETEILHSPEKQAEVIAAYRQNPVVEKDNTLEETFATQPDNIYISPSDDDKTAVYKIGDFGNAVLNGQWTTEEGDGGYVAPELLANEAAASPACDIYSFGATIYEVASGSRVPRATELRTCGVPRPPESCSDALARADPLNLSARSHPALTGQTEQGRFS